MSASRWILASLTYHWRINGAVVLGVAVASAVLTGSLIVGDSVRSSLRDLVLARLGVIDEVLFSQRFFPITRADTLTRQEEVSHYFTQILPLILLRGTLETVDRTTASRQATGIQVIGCDKRFWQLDRQTLQPEELPGRQQVVLNRPLADKLGVRPGDQVLLRIPRWEPISGDSPLGHKTDRTRSGRFSVHAIVPATGLGRFDLSSTQQLPEIAFVAMNELQSFIEQLGRANAMVAIGGHRGLSPKASLALAQALRPPLSDYGLSLSEIRQEFAGELLMHYFQLTSDQMMLPPEVERAALRALSNLPCQPVLTYLANEISLQDGQAKIPYSTITGIDSTRPWGPLWETSQTPIALADDEIILNRWAADDFTAQDVVPKPGDQIDVSYFAPEGLSGNFQERTTQLRLKTIVPLAKPHERPLPTNDPHLTPPLKGVTDEDSIEDWDPPFPFDSQRVRSTPPQDQDEQYWNAYRTTPKAFVSLATARRLWQNRFGASTSIRIPPAVGLTRNVLEEKIRAEMDPAAMGFSFQPLKRLGLQASSGTTPFGLLFLLSSVFLIAAAVMLTALLFRLGIELRAAEMGLLAALGVTRRQSITLFAAEGVLLAALGGGLGAIMGSGFAWLILGVLQSPDWWLAAIQTPFLHLQVRPTTLLLGGLMGTVISAVVIALSLWRFQTQPTVTLLAGHTEPKGTPQRRSHRMLTRTALAIFCLAVFLGLNGAGQSGLEQAGLFFGSGALVLSASLLLLWIGLCRRPTASLIRTSRAPLVQLALRNSTRHPERTALSVGVVATASFLILAMGVFRLSPSSSGTGSFSLLAETVQPIYHDLNSLSGREAVGAWSLGSPELDDSTIFALRVQEGDDASCLNLYQPRRPRILGVPAALIRRGGFAWSDSEAVTAREKENPWQLLEKRLPDAIPVVLDKNTAVYSLHLQHGGLGATWELPHPQRGKIKLHVVGLLSGSVLQGQLMIAESQFTQLFPNVDGYRFFLIDTPESTARQLAHALGKDLHDYGLTTVTANYRLAQLMAVQNTYLSAFQSLGALGLLLGTLGLATVQLRNVLERRGELAILRACGFPQRRLAKLVGWESACLLASGLLLGLLAALIAILPHLLSGRAQVSGKPLVGMLALIFFVGLATSTLTVRRLLRAPLMVALRGG